MFEIKIYVDKESDLYCSYDKDHLTINGDLRDYLWLLFRLLVPFPYGKRPTGGSSRSPGST